MEQGSTGSYYGMPAAYGYPAVYRHPGVPAQMVAPPGHFWPGMHPAIMHPQYHAVPYGYAQQPMMQAGVAWVPAAYLPPPYSSSTGGVVSVRSAPGPSGSAKPEAVPAPSEPKGRVVGAAGAFVVSQGIQPSVGQQRLLQQASQQQASQQQASQQQASQQQPRKGTGALAKKVPWLFPQGTQPPPPAVAGPRRPQQPAAAAVTATTPAQQSTSTISSSSAAAYSAVLARRSCGAAGSDSRSSQQQAPQPLPQQQPQQPATGPLQDIQLRPLPTDAAAVKSMQAEFQFALFGRHAKYVISLLQPAAAEKLRCLMRLSPADLTMLMKQRDTEQLLDSLWERHRTSTWEYVLGSS